MTKIITVMSILFLASSYETQGKGIETSEPDCG